MKRGRCINLFVVVIGKFYHHTVKLQKDKIFVASATFRSYRLRCTSFPRDLGNVKFRNEQIIGSAHPGPVTEFLYPTSRHWDRQDFPHLKIAQLCS